MSASRYCYTRPFKIVVVGEIESGKTKLVRKFITGGSKLTVDENTSYKPTSVCDGFKVALKANVKQRLENGSFKTLTKEDVAMRLNAQTSFLSMPSNESIKSPTDVLDELSWEDIEVDLQELQVKWPRDDPTILGKKLLKQETPAPVGKVDKSTQTSRGNSFNEKDLRGCESFPDVFRVQAENLSDQRAETCSSLPNALTTYSPIRSRRRLSSKKPPDLLDIELDLWDTGGDKKFTWYRWYACTGADVVLLCVPLSSILTFADHGTPVRGRRTQSRTKISEDLQKFMSDELLSEKTKSKKAQYRVPPVLLVGTKSDVCLESTPRKKFAETDLIEKTRHQLVDSVGVKLAVEAGCCDFITCSSLNGSNLAEVFEKALAISLTSNGKYRTSKEREVWSNSSENEAENFKEQESPAYFRMHSAVKREKEEEMKEFTEAVLGDDSFVPFVRARGGRTRKAPQETPKVEPKPKPEPLLFFPPPPNSSPPSTRPPSSDISNSAMSSSLESLIDSASERPELNSLELIDNLSDEKQDSEMKDDLPSDVMDNPKIVQDTEQEKKAKECVPIPSPRTLLSKLPTGPIRTDVNENFSRDQYQTPTPPSTPLSPTQSTISSLNSPCPSPRRAKLSREKRRSQLFVKFLKS